MDCNAVAYADLDRGNSQATDCRSVPQIVQGARNVATAVRFPGCASVMEPDIEGAEKAA